jgi:hypothetical protein
MRIIRLKKISISKIAVLATGLTAAVLVATVSPPPAQAFPSRAQDCTNCHGSALAGTVTAVPSTTTPAAGAAYTVDIAIITTAAGNAGYWIANSDAAGVTGSSVLFGGDTAATTYMAAMTAPASAGVYYYKVWGSQGSQAEGQANFALYSITVGPAPTTTSSTTEPTTSTTSSTTEPTTSTTSSTTEPTTSTTSSTTEPTTSTTSTLPPESIAHIRSLSPKHGAAGTKVTIRGTGFGTSGVVKFGGATAKASSWTNRAIVVRVPKSAFTMELQVASVPVWYRHDRSVSVTVTPQGAATSNAVGFRLDSRRDHGDHGDHGHHGHHGHHGDHRGEGAHRDARH